MRAAMAALTQAVAELARWIATVERPHPIRVAIDGRTAAGKTTLADELVAPIEACGRPVIRIRIDDFHRPRAARRQRQELPAWQRYFLDTFNHPAIHAALLPLGLSGDRRYRRAWFDLHQDIPIDEPWRIAPSDAVVLIDGIFLFRPELDDLWDVRLFVLIDADDTLRRGSERDRAWLGSVEEAAARYRSVYVPGENYYIETFRPHERADVVIDNRDPTMPRLAFRQSLQTDGK